MDETIQSVVPVNPILAQIGATLQHIRDDVAELGARIDNQRIMGHNDAFLNTHQRGRSTFPLKQVPGDGTPLLEAGAGFDVNTINHAITWQIPAAGPPKDGTRPTFIDVPDPVIATFTDSEICGLVRFYNEAFKIIIGDSNHSIEIKNQKFRDWMMGFS